MHVAVNDPSEKIVRYLTFVSAALQRLSPYIENIKLQTSYLLSAIFYISYLISNMKYSSTHNQNVCPNLI
jgi:hypothetical protein